MATVDHLFSVARQPEFRGIDHVSVVLKGGHVVTNWRVLVEIRGERVEAESHPDLFQACELAMSGILQNRALPG